MGSNKWVQSALFLSAALLKVHFAPVLPFVPQDGY